MMKATFCFLIIVVALTANFMFGAIPAEERVALIALYKSTNWDGWKTNIRWKTPPLHTDGFAAPGTEGNWWGVTVSGDHVTQLHLGNNDLIGSIPSELGNLSYLEGLWMDNTIDDIKTNGNQLSSSIPSELGNFIHLEELWMDNTKNDFETGWNQLSGDIPSQLGNLSNLKYLGLNRNKLTGVIPSQLSNLSKLETLNLSFNHLSGAIPSELANLSSLRYLDLGMNQLSGNIPYQLGNLSNLTILFLYNNQLSGGIPSQLGNLSNLIALYLDNNQLSGSIPSELSNLSKLKHLFLFDNQLSGNIPPQLCNLSNLQYFWLSINQLSGDIPPELENLSNLQYLNLRNNQLTGGIPPQLGNLSKLWWLSLNTNQLSGTIPSELGNLSNLQMLSLNNNQLSGSIPSELGNLNSLTELLLNDNQLSGTIPSELGNLDDLWELYLNNNYLSGSIPSQLGNLSKLGYLYLGMNQLYGDIPSSFMNLTHLVFLDIGYNCLYATDSALRAWLNFCAPDWEVSQCIEKEPPFGEFVTPISGSTVSSSIAITGWALDDHGVDSVKIYLQQENALIYIGDAIFVEGARPDVEIAYPGYPGNKKAGWGYMLLTNLLPNSGNGTFVIHAIATDKYGKITTLGAKTIIVDNINAVKPFGAIDTPIQGGTASGKKFINNGWALTPQPNMIPVDGSTIDVVIDGVVKGHPVYNVYRSDIAALFPGYANTNGAVGYYYLDATKLANGVHTIAWVVTDSAGNSDGIGSRYFTVQNSGVSGQESGIREERRGAPPCAPVLYPYSPAFDEIKTIDIQELERVEVKLSTDTEEISAGYLVVGDQLRQLPIGSTLDKERGIFYWQPGPGFVGEYRLVFIEKGNDGQLARKNIIVNIKPI